MRKDDLLYCRKECEEVDIRAPKPDVSSVTDSKRCQQNEPDDSHSLKIYHELH